MVYKVARAQNPLALLNRITLTGQSTETEGWTTNAPEARAALKTLQAQPAFADYADWLRTQLEDVEVAEGAAAQARVVFRPSRAEMTRTGTVARTVTVTGTKVMTKVKRVDIPLYDVWVRRIKKHPHPARAKEFLPVLRDAFAQEGVPVALVWLAETESMFNPRARSPAGARGLFQLMPTTAKSLGLSVGRNDQRTHPAASARAAAQYLKKLHARFGDWPLALAAYNGGEARVAQILKARGAKDFASIAAYLPAETRVYVPKVFATIQIRTGVSPAELAAPRG